MPQPQAQGHGGEGVPGLLPCQEQEVLPGGERQNQHTQLGERQALYPLIHIKIIS